MKNCKKCDKPIPVERLEALPGTDHCVQCVDGSTPQIIHDPEVICAKASPSGQNGFSPKS